MGLFSSNNSKAIEVETLINLITERTGEYMEIQMRQPHAVHPSVSQMLGGLYDSLFKSYYPNKQDLDARFITVKAMGVANRMPIAYWIKAIFSIGLSFEQDLNCKIFKD